MPAASSVLSSIRAGFTASGTRSTAVLDSVVPSQKTELQTQLDVLDEVLVEVEQQIAPQESNQDPRLVVAQAVPMAVAQATNTLNPTTPTSSAKEVAQPAAQLEAAAAQPVDLGGGYQLVEVEPSAELSPEVDGFIQEVKDHQEQLPQEIVIADGSMQLLPPPPVLQKVVVLPITPEMEQVGARKNPKFSIRWLVEWSRRLMKIFSGKIVYTQETT